MTYDDTYINSLSSFTLDELVVYEETCSALQPQPLVQRCLVSLGSPPEKVEPFALVLSPKVSLIVGGAICANVTCY